MAKLTGTESTRLYRARHPVQVKKYNKNRYGKGWPAFAAGFGSDPQQEGENVFADMAYLRDRINRGQE